MAGPAIKPTPTQEENDRARSGEHVIDHEPDGSGDDTGIPGGPPPPVLNSLAPTQFALPDVSLTITGEGFSVNARIVFDGVPQSTTRDSATQLRTSIVGFAGPAGAYAVLVRDDGGDSNARTFTFVAPASGDDAEQARGRRRR